MSWKVRTTPGHSPWWSSPYASLQPLHMQSPNSHQVRTSRRSRVCESGAVPALRRVVLSLNSCRVARGNEKTDRVQQIAAEKENGARACSWLSRQKSSRFPRLWSMRASFPRLWPPPSTGEAKEDSRTISATPLARRRSLGDPIVM